MGPGLALEVSGGTTKTARRGGSRTIWQVLRDGLDTRLADDLEAWEQYERASHGRKQVMGVVLWRRAEVWRGRGQQQSRGRNGRNHMYRT